MGYNYAVSILQKATIELGGKIIAQEAMSSEVAKADDVSKLAQQLLFGNLLENAAKEEREQFLELIEAIRLLKAQE